MSPEKEEKPRISIRIAAITESATLAVDARFPNSGLHRASGN
jgi:hypothetical protein